MHLFHVLGVVAGETEDTLTTYFTMACPRLFIGAKTDWPKMEAEGRERGGPASPRPSPPATGSLERCELPNRVRGGALPPKGILLFQHSGWPLLTL